MVKNKESYSKDSDERKIANLYENYMNTEERNKQGMEPVKKIFEKIRNINSLDELNDLYKEKTQKVRDFYSTVKASNGKSVNGDLTVGENIADISGVRCSLDIVKNMDNPNYKDFFESYAKIWRFISTPEVLDNQIQFDVHSPSKVRVNAVLSQIDEFYTTYGITPNDKMYVKPEDRLQIW